MSSPPTFWQTFRGVIFKPLATLRRLEIDEQPLLKGLLALFLVIAGYTLILAIFILRNYPAAAPSLLPLTLEEHYRYQVWYQGPLFLADTLLLGGLLLLLAKIKGQASSFAVAFARVSFATTVPFAMTTMLVELAVALLLLAGLLQPQAVLGWLTGAGVWFASLYQLAGIGWLAGLLVIAVQLTLRLSWWLSVLVALPLVMIYGLPIGLFIR